jgi:diguanylate cyclase (GGDEF)-like protein
VKKSIPLPEAILQEDELIRRLLADRERLIRSFPPNLELLFWQSIAERSLHMIRAVTSIGLVVYLSVGILTFLTVYFLTEERHRLHDILIWLLTYLNGAFCLVTLPVVAGIPSLTRYFQRVLISIVFLAVFFTSFLTVQYEEVRLIQQGSYIVVFVYMLAYFLTGIRPLVLLITCLIAGLLPLPLLWVMEVRFDPVVYFYAVIVSNVVGFMVSYIVTGKERVSFLQARLLELDKIHSDVMSNELVRLSNEDALTGLYNRRYLNETIAIEWERAERSEEPLSVVFVDIDYFKLYNDTYGHLQGDKALIRVAGVLRKHMRRTSDIAARYGGEEFVLLLPNTPSAGAQVVANNIMRAVDSLKIEHKTSNVAEHLTLSIGVATWAQEENMTMNKLIAQADAAVYQAKAEGRHAIRVFGVE